MNKSLRIRLGAVVLALLTVAAIVFAVLNFQQRSRFIVLDDGVTWVDTTNGVSAWHIVPGSPADRAGIRPGDIVESIRRRADSPGYRCHAGAVAPGPVVRRSLRNPARRRRGSGSAGHRTASQSFLHRELPAPDGSPVPFHRPVHFRPPVERSASHPFLRFLPGLVRSLQLPLHGKAELV